MKKFTFFFILLLTIYQVQAQHLMQVLEERAASVATYFLISFDSNYSQNIPRIDNVYPYKIDKYVALYEVVFTDSIEVIVAEGMGWMYLKDDLNKSGSKVVVNHSGLGEECHRLVKEVLAGGNRKVYVTGLVSSDYLPENGGDVGCCDEFAEIYSRTISKEEQ